MDAELITEVHDCTYFRNYYTENGYEHTKGGIEHWVERACRENKIPYIQPPISYIGHEAEFWAAREDVEG